MASSSRIASKLPLEMLYHWERQCPDRVYLRQTINREYVDFTWGEVADEARRMVTALRHLGLVPGVSSQGDRSRPGAGQSEVVYVWSVRSYNPRFSLPHRRAYSPLRPRRTQRVAINHKEVSCVITKSFC